MHINRGAGAFVCGEGSALTASIEGKRGMPRVKPPRTVEHGLLGEAHGAQQRGDLRQRAHDHSASGADWYRGIGTPRTAPAPRRSPLPATCDNTGLIEVPMGTTLREIIFDVGGGIARTERKFKAVQIGGPSGGCLTEEASGPATGL